MKKSIKERIIGEAQAVSFILIGLAIFGFVLIMGQLTFYDGKPENFGSIGDALGGVLNPIIAIATALLTFLAFYIQKLANDITKEQFKQNQIENHQDFLFNNYKERAMLIINEVNNFNISFHNGTLISNTDELKVPNAKKYNFIGIQAINLFYVEFYKLMGKDYENFKPTDSFHSISMHLNNLIVAFYNLHLSVENSELKKNYQEELQELLSYIYYSKFNYFFGYLLKQRLNAKLKPQIEYLYEYYNNQTRVEK